MPGARVEALPGVRTLGSRDLPVRRHKARIVEKVIENRVTLIFADTGSGKSSQVPQMLLEEGLSPILCTQPRRLAVVAVAKRVAEERGCGLGNDVGYQIGQLNLSTTRTKIVFKTAGILFEELRTNGSSALSKYKVVILDEVHERSVESDLVLTCLKQLLRTTSVKLVLMSATADLLKYEEYFNEIDRGEGVEKIAIQNLSEKLQSVILNTKVVYLEQAVKLLGSTPQHTAVLDAMNENFAPAVIGIDIGDQTQNLMKDLIVHLHHSQQDLSKNVLVFLPTYRALEQQWLLLKATREPFQVYVLHSSVDMERSIQAMEACPLRQRKIILATNVAESSVTIPGVSFVIDACRHLEVYWDISLKKHQPRIVWVSESQANQRKGRTGRTCDGVVYRLVPRNHFLRFEKFETPAVRLLSLRKQALMITCASSKALNDPTALLRKCMNPPASETIQDALETLEDMDAIHCDTRGKHQPTLYGQLLVSLPLSLEASVLVVRGGQLGYPRESAVLAAILDSTPNPILRPFGDPSLYPVNLDSYYKLPNNEEGQRYPLHSTVMLANLHAYQFWQHSFKDKERMDLLVQQARDSRLHIDDSQKSDKEILELDWCTEHSLSLTSLRSIAETVDTIMEALHRFRPKFISNISGPPSYITTDIIQHVCSRLTWNDDSSSSQESELKTSDDAHNENAHDDGHNGNAHNDEHNEKAHDNDDDGDGENSDDAWNDWSFQESEKQRNGHVTDVSAVYSENVNSSKECDNSNGKNPNSLDEGSGHAQVSGSNHQYSGNGKAKSSHYYNGNDHNSVCDQYIGNASDHGDSSTSDEQQTCSSVPYAQSGTFHSLEIEQILSALLVEGCRFGDACRFSHEDPQKFILPGFSDPVNFDEPIPTVQTMLNLLPALNNDEFLLLFGEGDFSFAEALSNYIDPRRILATCLDEEDIFLRDPNLSQRLSKLTTLQMQIIWNVDVTSLTTCTGKDKKFVSVNLTQSIPWHRVRCVLWNFPFANIDEDEIRHQILMRSFFASLSIIMMALKVQSVPVIITLCNDQYCRWQVERAARNSFFFLRTSVPFDVDTFGGYHPLRNNLQSTFPVHRPLIYVFELYPPINVLGKGFRDRI